MQYILGVVILETSTFPTQLGRHACKTNFGENIINIIVDVPGKTKGNVNARLDLEEFSMRDELHLRTRKNGNTYKPKLKCTLSLEQGRLLCEWLLKLSLPDGYGSNFSY